MDDRKLRVLSGRVIGCAITVSKHLAPGYLEKVYENALFYELTKQRLRVERQVRLDVYYDGIVVGHFIADMVVNNTIILELKAADGISEDHIAQALNYLTTTGSPLCLILNFGEPVLSIKRVRNWHSTHEILENSEPNF